MNRLGGTVREIAGEALWIGGLLGAFWFASWLYEIGFMARFRVPAALVEIGIPRLFGIVGIAGLLGALGVAALLSAAGAAARRAFLPLSVLAAIITAAAVAAELPAELASILPMPLGPDTSLVKTALLSCLVFYAARLFASCLDWAERADFGRIAQASLLTLALLALPVWLGWLGGQHKAESPRSFFYLADDRRFVLVRIYDDKAIFVRRDPETGSFESRYLVHRFDDPLELYVTRAVR